MPFCQSCGKPVEDGTICTVCVEAQDHAQTDHQKIVVRRFTAGVLDLLFAAGVAFGVAAWMVTFKKIIPIPGLRKVAGLSLPIIIWIFYLLLKDGFNGKSLGKALCNVSVVNKHGRPAGLIDSINRNWPLWIPPLTLIVGIQLLFGHRTRLGETRDTSVIHDDDLLSKE